MPDTPENEGFTFRDRRRTTSEAPAEPEESPSIVVHDRRTAAQSSPPPANPAPVFGAAPPPPAFGAAPEPPAFVGFDAPAPEDPAVGGEVGDDPGGLPDVRDYLFKILMMMRSLGAIRLGLVANPETGRPAIDLEQARLAIDTVAFLVEQLEAYLPAQERLPVRAMVSELRNRYVALAREASGG